MNRTDHQSKDRAELYDEEKSNDRMKNIGQNGNEGLHYPCSNHADESLTDLD